ncbi:MAG: flagellar biosynthesis anti-sigma factor FlgM [Phycisphaerales bacterium]|nr:MAG: flagellar biosynthesis anti-sigma factor FlgM [Phycisphaerales bacterium]
MPDSDSNTRFQGQNRKAALIGASLGSHDDLTMEQILENINATPIGQVLKRIASLPEVRKEKVLNVRRQLTEGKYDINERLDVALDRVLEDLTA